MVPMAPSTSNLASLRVLPPFCIARAISSSRAACRALLQAFKSSPRCENVSSRRAGPPRSRLNSTAAAKSMPLVEVRARGSSVAGLTSVAKGSLPSTHLPSTKLRSVFMGGLIAQANAPCVAFAGRRRLTLKRSAKDGVEPALMRRGTRRGLAIAGSLPRRTGERFRHLRERIRDHRDGGGVLRELLGIDLVQRIRRAVMDVEIVGPVSLHANQRHRGGLHRAEVGAPRLAALQAKAERLERRDPGPEHRYPAIPRAEAHGDRAGGSAIGLECRDVLCQLRLVGRGVCLSSGQAVLLVHEEHHA